MSNVYLVHAAWFGGFSHDGRSKFAFMSPTGADLSGSQLSSAAYKVNQFFGTCARFIPADVSIQIETEVDVYDRDTGVISGTVALDPAESVCVGTDTDDYANGAGAHIRWITSDVFNRHRIKGGTFLVPLGHSAWGLDGKLNPDAVTSITAAAHALPPAIASTGVSYMVYAPPRDVKATTRTAAHHSDAHWGNIIDGVVSSTGSVLGRRR